ncbi:YdcH family protein [Hyphomonas sp.]|uniref:YdcH family protein n=1 Tax=Hyphomonas sp. TaxID=87 RepID=UPI0039195919
MSLDGRISELANKHRQLDEQISAEQKRPSRDDLTVKDLKRQKLRVKEQLRQLKPS